MEVKNERQKRISISRQQLLFRYQKSILDARKRIYTNIKYEMVFAYWQIGKMIVDKQGGEDRAEYGSGLIKELSQQMTRDFGKGFDERNLELMRQFYRSFPNPNTVCTQLSWSHLRLLMRVNGEKARNFYINESIQLNWSVRQLEREIY